VRAFSRTARLSGFVARPVTASADRVSRARQSWRALRVLVHVGRGIAITTFVFPRASAAQKRALNRAWSRHLLALLGVEPRVQGEIHEAGGNVVYLANHVSWLDIFVLDAHSPARFIAKAELARWPLVGKLVRETGTIFVTRARKADTLRVNAIAAEALRGGDVLAVFPEGTTTDGTALLKFHGSLLQPVIDSAGHVQPIALRYAYRDGRASRATQYAGDTSLARSFWSICGARDQVIEVIAHPPIAASTRTRRELAALSEAAIRASLALPASAQPASATAPQKFAASRDRPR
jgi:1-acyl-sn-glycerol-3-phosphate acyltransferase